MLRTKSETALGQSRFFDLINVSAHSYDEREHHVDEGVIEDDQMGFLEEKKAIR